MKLTSAAGMLAGCIGRVICHPFDTIKAKLYVFFFIDKDENYKNKRFREIGWIHFNFRGS